MDCIKVITVVLAGAVVCGPLSARGPVINEFMASNGTVWADEDGDYEDWIEIHNPGTEAVNLAGHGLSDDLVNPLRWVFPEVWLQPGQHLLVWASGKDRRKIDPPVRWPSAVPGLVLWLRASAERYQNDEPVPQWRDRSGRRNHATQPTPSRQPLFRRDAINGHPAILFNAAEGQWLDLPVQRFQGLESFSDFTLMSVVRRKGDSAPMGVFGAHSPGSNHGNLHFEVHPNGQLRLRVGQMNGILLPPDTRYPDHFAWPHAVRKDAWHLLAGFMDSTRASPRAGAFIDRRLLGTRHQPAGPVPVGEYDHLWVGSSYPGRGFHGYIAEILLFNRALEATERMAIETYLLGKYGLKPPFALHTNFKISRQGEPLLLTAPSGQLIDQTGPVLLPRDLSHGRLPDGGEEWAYFTKPTPGAPNTGPAYQSPVETIPAYSHPGGTYSDSFHLELSTSLTGAVIRFTLDGTVPTEVSPLFNGPFRVTESLQVRARVFVPGKVPGPVATETYVFLAPEITSFSSNLPIVLVDCLGQGNLPDTKPDQPGFMAIFEPDHSGRSNLVSSPPLQSRVGLRRRGQSTLRPIHLKPSLSVETWREDRDEEKDIEPLGFPAESDWILYAPDRWDPALLRTPLGNIFSESAGRRAPRWRFVEVFIRVGTGPLSRDHYAGVYVFMEGIKRGHNRVDLERLGAEHDTEPEISGGYIFRRDKDYVGTWAESVFFAGGITREHRPLHFYRPRDPTPVQREWLISHLDSFKEALDRPGLGDPENEYAAFIDVGSWINTNLVKMFAANIDYPRLSTYYHKDRNGKIHAGPVWDWDRSMGSIDARDDNPETWVPGGSSFFRTSWWDRLFQDPGFWQPYIDRWAELRQTEFSNARLSAVVDSLAGELAESGPRNFRRWSGVSGVWFPPRFGDWEGEVHHLKNWLIKRAEWIDSQMIPPPGFGHQGGEIEEGYSLPLLAPPHGTGTVYYTLDGSDPRLPGGGLSPSAKPWNGSILIEDNITLIARVFDPNHWSETGGEGPYLPIRWSAATRAEYFLRPPHVVHYWNFNIPESLLEPSYTSGGAFLMVETGSMTVVTHGTGQDFRGENARMGDEAGSHLRLNNPLGAAIVFSLPTTGFRFPVFRYETRRSGQGAGIQELSYTVDGEIFTPLETVTVFNDVPVSHSLDLSGLPGTDNNPDFAIRITFAQGAGGDAGNNRFDNITLDGVPLAETNLPPWIKKPVHLVMAIENGPPHSLDLTRNFLDPEGDPLSFTVAVERDRVAKANLSDGILSLYGLRCGETDVAVTASDGQNPSVSMNFRLLVYPRPWPLAHGAFLFSQWDPGKPDHAYPPHMIFLQSGVNDPDLDTPLVYAYHVPHDDYNPDDFPTLGFPYNNTRRTRINGLGDGGISFINTGRGRDLGGAMLALDTRGVGHAEIEWIAGTVIPNSRVYALRLQYRVGFEGPFADVSDSSGNPVVYPRNPVAGHAQALGPSLLPPTALNQPYVQLLWRYHHVEVDSGPRAELRLGELFITPSKGQPDFLSYQDWRDFNFPDPGDRDDPLVSGPGADPTGWGIANLTRYALALGLTSPGPDRLPSAEIHEGRLSIEFPMDPGKTDIAWVVEASSDLTDWGEVVFDSRLTMPPAGAEPFTKRAEDTVLISGASGGRFLRLRVILLAP